jgi:uncharacterized protein YyaL (SSP411 family)
MQMGELSKLLNIISNSIIHPTHISMLLRSLSGSLYTATSDIDHLAATMDWLKKSQDTTEDGSCAGVYTFEKGWSGPYPETTGYIIETFLDYFELVNDQEYFVRAKRMADWEIDMQLSSGAVRGGIGINEYPIIFNTGQVILGWMALYNMIKEDKYLDASIKASQWLITVQESDGKWNQHTFNNRPHAYNSRTAWALLEVDKAVDHNKFYKAAIKKVEWVLTRTNSNGWIDFMEFEEGKEPFTHTIAYTLRGLLECSHYVNKEIKNEIIGAVLAASKNIINAYESLKQFNKSHKRFMPGSFDNNWDFKINYSCLTGNAQLAIIWMKLSQITGDPYYHEIAMELVEQLKTTQSLKSNNEGIRGGIAGSYPIWGDYVSFGYPNWASKFFADAIILKMSIISEAKK